MFTRYGIEFPNDSPDASVELWMYRNQDVVIEHNGDLLGQAYHLSKAFNILFDDNILTWHPWLDEHIDIWCDNRFATIWGPAACGKSNDFGLIALVDWWSAPKDTCTFVCSTTKPMLEKRIWESIVRYFNSCRGKAPGIISKQRTAIINQDDDGKSADEVKAGITGVAVQMGTIEDAVSNLIGAHLPYVRLIVDEMQATRLAAVEARKNLSKGCKEFKFVGMGNPMSFLDPLGTYSEPLSGWSSVSVDSYKWDTAFGRCYHFDGLKSPAITEPGGAKKYPFLINEEQINADIKENGGEVDHPDIWTMCRGFVPSEGISKTVLSPAFIDKFNMKDQCELAYDYVTIAGLDPAFTSDGDDCIFLLADVGMSKEGVQTIRFRSSEKLIIQASASEPVAYQIANQTIQRCQDNNVAPYNFGIDESGVQSIGDVIEILGFKGIHRIGFGERASNLPVSNENPVPGHEYYGNKVSELWYVMRQFGKYNQIRGMDEKISRDFCERLIVKLKPVTVEPKGKTSNKIYKGMKARLNRSPDFGDAAAIVLDVARNCIGMMPGETKEVYNSEFNRANMDYDLDGREDKYLVDQFGAAV